MLQALPISGHYFPSVIIVAALEAYICKEVSTHQILVHSSVGRPQSVTTSLQAGGSQMVPVSSNIHPPLVSAKQAYRPPEWLFGIQFGKPFGKHFSQCLPQITSNNPNSLCPPLQALWQLSFASFLDYLPWCPSVDYLVCSQIIFRLIWNCLGSHISTHLADHLSGALTVRSSSNQVHF